MYGGANVFQCSRNRLPHEVFQRRFNFAYGWNIYGLDGLLIKRDSAVSPSDCVVLGDTAGWKFSSIIVSSSGSTIRNLKSSTDTLKPPFLSPAAGSGLVPRYNFSFYTSALW